MQKGKPPIYLSVWFIILLFIVGFFGVLITDFSLLLWLIAIVLLINRIVWNIKKRNKKHTDVASLPDIDWDNYKTAKPDYSNLIPRSMQEDFADLAVHCAESEATADVSDDPSLPYSKRYSLSSIKKDLRLVGAIQNQSTIQKISIGDKVLINPDTDNEKYAVRDLSAGLLGYLPKSSNRIYESQFAPNQYIAFICEIEQDSRGRSIPHVAIFIPAGKEPSTHAKTAKGKRESFDFPESYVVIDTETTGLIASECEIIELAAIRIIDGQIVDRFSTLIKPKHRIPSSITAINGISNWMVRKAPSFDDIASDFLLFIGDYPLVGHNVSFDDRFISVSLKRTGRNGLKNQLIDTLELSRIVWPRYKYHKLQYLVEKLDLNTNGAHRALADCEATLQLYKIIRAKLA